MSETNNKSKAAKARWERVRKERLSKGLPARQLTTSQRRRLRQKELIEKAHTYLLTTEI